MNKTMKRNVVVSALLAIMLCVSLIAGATFALFTSESKTNVAVTSGKVDVVATMNGLTLYSPTSIDQSGNVVDSANAATATMFANGGTATADANTITLTNITPGDKVTFNIDVKNNSNVTVKYRTILACESDDGLFAGLKVTINGEEYIGETRVSAYEVLAAGTGDYTVPVTIELPTTADNAYQGKTMKLSYTVQAVQGNTETDDPENDTYYIYNANDLVLFRYFAPSVNNAVLMNDIDMSGTEYVAWDFAIPSAATFTFDGQGYAIKNLTTTGYTGANNNENDFQRAGLFANVTSADTRDTSVFGTIVFKDLVMDNATVSQAVGPNATVGALIGIANFVNVKIDGCSVVNSHITSAKYAAGFIGYAQEFADGISVTVNEVTVENNEIVGNGHTAGLVGLANKTVTIDKATIKGNIISTKLGHSAAALVGTGSVAATNVVANDNTYAGGLKNCTGDTKDDIFGIYHEQCGNYTVDGTGENNTIVEAYVVLSLYDLKVLRDTVNAGNRFPGQLVELWTDIDLKNENWTPIGTATNFFGGTFDGKNHTISNLQCNGGVANPVDLQAVNQGLFGYVMPTTYAHCLKIKNLTIKNVDIYAKNSAGAFVGCVDTIQHTSYSGMVVLENLTLIGKVTIEAGYSGGMAGSPVSHHAIQTGYTNLTVNVDAGSYVSNVKAVELSGGSAYSAGIIPIASYNREAQNITSNIDVISRDWAAGIVCVTNRFWKNVTCTGNVTVIDPIAEASKKYSTAIGCLAPTYGRRPISEEDAATISGTGTFTIQYADGTTTNSTGSTRNDINDFWAW